MDRNRSFNAVAMLVLSVVLASCGLEAAEEGARDHVITFDLPESGISLEEADSEAGILRGFYARGDSEIVFEAVRRERNPISEYAPVFAVDARLCDERGFCFAFGSGGHGITDASWFEHQDELQPDLFQARANHEAAMAFHEVLMHFDQPELSGLDDELSMLRALSDFSPPGELRSTPPPIGYEEVPDGHLRVLSNNYTHWIEIWRGPISAPLGNHSSTRSISVNSGGSWVIATLTSNHGAIPTGPNMTLYCSRSLRTDRFGWR